MSRFCGGHGKAYVVSGSFLINEPRKYRSFQARLDGLRIGYLALESRDENSSLVNDETKSRVGLTARFNVQSNWQVEHRTRQCQGFPMPNIHSF